MVTSTVVRVRGGSFRRVVVLVSVVCLSVGVLASCQLGSVTQLFAGGTHVCALRSDGSVQCWGSNSFGELGDGSLVDRSSPVVVGGLSGVVQVGGGLRFSCAVLVSGSVMCWGENSSGQLGDGTLTSRSTPGLVNGITTATQVSSGQGNHVCVRLADASARCWGKNSSGQLGDGTTLNRRNPVLVDGLVDVVSMAAGLGHTCALSGAGTESCWGSNSFGQLGDGTTTDRLAPVTVTGVSDVAQIAVGSVHSCAVRTGGTVTCWGANAAGQLGDGSVNDRSTAPWAVVGLSTVVQVAAGATHTCVLRGNGDAWCWGNNTFGQLGDDTTTARYLPVQVSGVGSPDQPGAYLAVGTDVSCAAMTPGNVKCWGGNTDGDLGEGTDAQRKTPVAVGVRGELTADSISAGSSVVCAVSSGQARCWGTSMTGDGTTAARTTPVDVLTGVTQMSPRCALVGTTVRCWGNNDNGQVGDGTTTDRLSPVSVQGLGGPVTQVTSGGSYACALMADGTVQCWGRGAQYGGAGPGTPLPSLVSGLTGVTQISSGDSHTCALLTDTTVKCWGFNGNGEVGNGTTTTQLTPATVAGLTGGAQISTGGAHTCARLTNGTVKCWGNNSSGQLGNGGSGLSTTPVSVTGMTTATQITSGGQVTCAVLLDQTAKCWGRNFYGQLGDGTKINRNVPTLVIGLNGVAEVVTASSGATCARVAGNYVKCWGRSAFVGDDGLVDRLTPVQVVFAV